MPKRSQVRVSEGLEARSERPATEYWKPEAGLVLFRPGEA